MKATPTRTVEQAESWPRKVQPGGEGKTVVSIYLRRTPSGNVGFVVPNYIDGKRQFDSYKAEADAVAAAEALAKRLDKRDFAAANLSKNDAIEFANAKQILAPFGVTVGAAASVVVECLKVVGDLSNVHAAVKYYNARHKQTIKKPVAEAVAELLKIKTARGASERYIKDLTGRLERFAADCKKDCCNVTTADVQAWLDGQKLKPQSYRNFRTVLHTLFAFAVSRGYATDNPVEGVERVKVNGGDVAVFTPAEIDRLLESARIYYPDFLPCLAIGAFAGLRSAEIERLEWTDIHMAEKFIVIGRDKAKTASRRVVPLHDNLAAWLAPYAEREGLLWKDSSVLFYKRQKAVARATAVKADAEKNIAAQRPVKWKSNALRHSYASYRFAQTGDAGRVAGECGNSAAVVHKHYRQLVKPADAERWFSVRPEVPANVLPIHASALKREPGRAATSAN